MYEIIVMYVLYNLCSYLLTLARGFDYSLNFPHVSVVQNMSVATLNINTLHGYEVNRNRINQACRGTKHPYN
jgi:hypothetical protein